ncbi:MAG: hypothetical protein RQ751_09405 [Longimicrobiales bacterium]|nr:hypothetical protein [Longimicrobiales bacterium]
MHRIECDSRGETGGAAHRRPRPGVRMGAFLLGTLVLAGCDDAGVGPDPVTLSGVVEGLDQVASIAAAPGVTASTGSFATLLVERSDAAVAAVEEASLDPTCGPSACLDFVLRVERDGLFTDRIRRRVFRGFLGEASTISKSNFLRTFWVLVTDDDPALVFDGEHALISFDNVRGLDLDSLPAAPGLVVHGATELSALLDFTLAEPDLCAQVEDFPDLSPVSAAGAVTGG